MFPYSLKEVPITFPLLLRPPPTPEVKWLTTCPPVVKRPPAKNPSSSPALPSVLTSCPIALEARFPPLFPISIRALPTDAMEEVPKSFTSFKRPGTELYLLWDSAVAFVAASCATLAGFAASAEVGPSVGAHRLIEVWRMKWTKRTYRWSILKQQRRECQTFYQNIR